MPKGMRPENRSPIQDSGWEESEGWLPGVQAGFTEHPQQRRSLRSTMQILSAAEQVLATLGARRFSMQAVADRAGVSVGAIYGRFDGKHGLLLAVKDLLLTKLEEDLARRLSTSDNLYGVVQGYVDCMLTHLSKAAVTAVVLDPEQPADLARRGAVAQQRFYELLLEAGNGYASEIRHEDEKAALQTIHNLTLGYALIAANRQNRSNLSGQRHSAEVARACYVYLTSPSSSLP